MNEIQQLGKNTFRYETAAMVTSGQVVFELTNSRGMKVFETVYEDTAEMKTANNRFVYSFSDLEVSKDLRTASASITRFNGSRPANNISVTLSIMGERKMEENNLKNTIIVIFILCIVGASLLTLGAKHEQIAQLLDPIH